MRIICWNCKMAFRNKADTVLKLQPDVLIIPECENASKLDLLQEPTDIFWYGENPNKGLGIFTFSSFKFEFHRWHNPDFKTIIPLAVNNGNEKFTLFAIWANNPQEPTSQYVGQVWKAINYYKQFLNNENIILAGDFNSNTIWDKKYRQGNHSHVVDFLAKKNIYSAYHHFYQKEHGKEDHPTFYLYHHNNKPYHLDYCFLSKNYIDKLRNVQVGKHEDWHDLSDHVPLIVDMENNISDT